MHDSRLECADFSDIPTGYPQFQEFVPSVRESKHPEWNLVLKACFDILGGATRTTRILGISKSVAFCHVGQLNENLTVVKRPRANSSIGLECDFIVHLRNGMYGLIEIKLGRERLIEEGMKKLTRLVEKP